MDAVINLHKPRSMKPAHKAQETRVRSESALLAPPHDLSRLASRTTPGQLVPAGNRVVLIAPHPDDEVLALGATLAALSRLSHEILIVAVTDGEGSHPGSSRWPADALLERRPRESHLALERLGIPAEMIRLGMPDGHVAEHEKKLAQLLPLGSADTVFVPWRHDGHADHEACARATLAACRTVDARCIEFPVWSLVPTHAAHPRLRTQHLQQVDLPLTLIQAKRHAVQAFTSQTEPDGTTPAVLTEVALDSWLGNQEWVLA